MRNSIREDGFALLFAVLTASLVLSIGLTIFNITLKEFILSSQIRDSQFAFYSADTGLECTLYWDLEHPNYAGSIFGYYGNTLSNGLVAYWKFDDNEVITTAADTTGNGHTGSVFNISASEWSDGSGFIGAAIAFDDDTSERVEIPDTSSLFMGNTITLAAWVQRAGTSTTDAIYADLRSGDVPTVEYDFEFQSNETQMVLYSNDGAGGQVSVAGTIGSYNLNDWIHVAVTWDGSDARFYLDGDLKDTRPFAYSPAEVSGRNFGIGRRIGGGAPFNGLIDEVRVYERVLSDSEIEDLYNATPGGDFTGPIDEESGVSCVSTDISAAVNDWTTVVDEANGLATTTFTLPLSGSFNRCARVTVAKMDGGTRIESRGYNSCDTNNPRRIERALRATY
ncbi:LamG domain-containing protein [Candidatus Wolfebacteria bacterium]|nr:LamG domain-containing protein [Candidatus Wolfebacteria bacterium]